MVAVEWIGRDEVDGGLPRRVAQAFAAAAGREDEVDRAHAAAAHQTGRARPRAHSVDWKIGWKMRIRVFPFL